MKFLADEHIELSIVNGLKLLGIDAISVNEAGKRESDDEKILVFARNVDRVIITRDSDFIRLHKKGFQHASIVFIPEFMAIGKIISEVEKVSILFHNESIRNTIIYIPLK